MVTPRPEPRLAPTSINRVLCRLFERASFVPRYITHTKLAVRLDVMPRTVARWAREGRFCNPTFVLVDGRTYRIPVIAVKQFLLRRGAAPRDVATRVPGERDRIEARRRALVAEEDALNFDPANRESDLQVLRQILEVNGQ